MIHRLSIAAILAAVISLPLGHDVSHAEPIRVSSDQAKALLESQRRASVAPTLLDESRLSDLLDLRLQPMPLVAPAQPGQRLGYGDVVLWLPIGEWWQLRTGVRVDYEKRPSNGTWQVEGMPTVGIGVRF